MRTSAPHSEGNKLRRIGAPDPIAPHTCIDPWTWQNWRAGLRGLDASISSSCLSSIFTKYQRIQSIHPPTIWTRSSVYDNSTWYSNNKPFTRIYGFESEDSKYHTPPCCGQRVFDMKGKAHLLLERPADLQTNAS